MDDSDQFDYAQVEHLLHLLSSSPSPPPPLTTNSPVPLQTQSCNLFNTPVPKRKTVIANIDQDTGKGKPPKEKENSEKKVVRRDVERQRRRDMARLYQRLRLLIPSKYLMVSIQQYLYILRMYFVRRKMFFRKNIFLH